MACVKNRIVLGGLKTVPILDCNYRLPPHLPHIRTDSLALKLATIKALEESDGQHPFGSNTLKMISDAIGQRISVTSNHNIEPVSKTGINNNVWEKLQGEPIKVSLSQNPVSLFTLIKNWYDYKSFIGQDGIIIPLMHAIIRGKRKLNNVEEKWIDGIHSKSDIDISENEEWIDSIRSASDIDIPKDIMLLILSFRRNHDTNIALIKKTEKKFFTK